MGRKKISIKPIVDEKVRKVTFNRRRNGILKKAYELSILCDTQVVILMFDQKEMCHVYSSEEDANSHATLMQKYITKDFCTVDPIRNYDTSPDLQLDDPSQAVWRVSREKVAVVNTYNVVPATGTPHIGSAKDEDDDEEADGSEQLSVKSSRTYHTKSGESKGGAHLINTPALTDNASPSMNHRSLSPEHRSNAASPGRTKNHATKQPQQYSQYPPQQGLGISGSGYTPLLRPGEQFAPILYPPQPSAQQMNYNMWPSPDLAQGQYARMSYLPNMGIQYANQQYQSQMQFHPYEVPQTQVVSQSPVREPLLKKSPRKEQAHFNHYTYPPPQSSSAPSQASKQQPPMPTHSSETHETGDLGSPAYTYEDDHHESVPLPYREDDENSNAGSISRQVAHVSPRKINHFNVRDEAHGVSKSPRKLDKDVPGYPHQQRAQFLEAPDLAAPEPTRRVTRSQSRSPQLKAQKVSTKGLQLATSIPKSQIPMHLRGPSLLDDITFDPETGVPMMESSTLANWLGGPLSNASPGHSRETSHVRGESVSQWLNLPQIPE